MSDVSRPTGRESCASREMAGRQVRLFEGETVLQPILRIPPLFQLLAFVTARKMLKPEITSVDILLSVTAFAALLAAKKYLLDRPHTFIEADSEGRRNETAK